MTRGFSLLKCVCVCAWMLMRFPFAKSFSFYDKSLTAIQEFKLIFKKSNRFSTVIFLWDNLRSGKIKTIKKFFPAIIIGIKQQSPSFHSTLNPHPTLVITYNHFHLIGNIFLEEWKWKWKWRLLFVVVFLFLEKEKPSYVSSI